METITINNSVFLIPPSQPKLQANCAKEYGQFLLDCPPKLTILEAQAGGYLKGNKADFAIAISRPDRVFTINENFVNEPFTELWVIPVSGGLKEQFKGPASMLFCFLMHRRSKDRFASLYNHFAHRAFQEWCEEGMPGDPKEFCYGAIASVLRNYIFCVEFQKVDGAKGSYWFIQWSYRLSQSDFENDALEAAQMIRSGAEEGATLHWVTNETYERWASNAETAPALPPVSEVEARASLQAHNQQVLPQSKKR
ncbi:hypothetical protein [Nostoc sp. MG11]|uniref:hypothetical protein n=1 Tax=Nostoc sp. MG11 TaxID=2721166 RepID=UPI001868B0E7|nr:hypothetical protein [Nostoc sp. MG11]